MKTRFRECRHSRRAFSLVEFIGVLAILSILAALTVPAVIRQIDQAARTKETADLKDIGDALKRQILATRRIPLEADMAQQVASWTRQPTSKITATPRGYTRAFLIDPSGWFSTAAGTLPYTQSTNGTVAPPVNARVIIVSTLDRNPPVATGLRDIASFNDLWNTPDGVKPASWAAWGGKGEDVFIQRVNLEPLFHRLVLVNRDPPGSAGFAIGSTMSMGLTNSLKSYYLDGTDVGLYDGASPPNSEMRVLLVEDRSFVFSGRHWMAGINSDETYSDVAGNEFASLAGQFLATEWFPGAHKGGNQQGAVISMFDFMMAYQLWANQCPHFCLHGETTRNNVPEYVLMLGIAGDLSSSSLLNSFTGSDGLLK